MKYYACSKYTATNAVHLGFVECFDSTLITSFPKGLPAGTVNETFAKATLKVCATKGGLDYSKLDACTQTSEGAGYFDKERVATPAHKGVPFVTINGGAPVYNSQTLNLIDEVCKAYTGATKPAACNTQAEVSPDAYTSMISLA